MMDNEALTNKKKRSERSLPAKGDNSDALLKDHVAFIAAKQMQMEKLGGEIKERLSMAKNEGFLKMSIRKAVKNLRSTEEQRQAKRAVDEEAERYTALCRDLPLFAQAA